MNRRSFLTLAMAAPAVLRADDVTTKAIKPVQVFQSPGPQPNGLQATSDGLWILDQRDNKAYLVSYENGEVLRALQTESDRGSGITFDGQAIWIASTYNCKILQSDARTGETLKSFPTPGCGVVQWGNRSNSVETGAHGIEFREGRLWIAVPPSMTIYRVRPDDLHVEAEIPAPGERPHGIGWQGDWLWCTESNHKAFYRLDSKTGKYSLKLQLAEDDPVPHGMTIWNNQLWYCDADTRAVCRFELTV